MPLYEYQCMTCGKQFEKMVSFAQAGQKPECPECHSNDTQKRLSLFASTGSSANSSGVALSRSCGSNGRFT